MSMEQKLKAFGSLVKSWLASPSGLNTEQAIVKAGETLAEMAAVDFGGPVGGLAVTVAQGLIEGNATHPAITTAEGVTVPAGPVNTPQDAAIRAIHTANQILGSLPEGTVPPVVDQAAKAAETLAGLFGGTPNPISPSPDAPIHI